MRRALIALLLAALVMPAQLVLALVLAGPAHSGDPRWVFYSRDRTHHTSPWFARAHRTMIGYGCTRAPYYAPDRRCRRDRGFHHGIDIAMPCGTRLFAGRMGWVVSNDALGPAYGVDPLLIRNHRLGVDFLIGHTERVFVEEGDRVRRGMRIANANDSAAPDGCHLHFEVRRARGGLDSARRPGRYLDLRDRR